MSRGHPCAVGDIANPDVRQAQFGNGLRCRIDDQRLASSAFGASVSYRAWLRRHRVTRTPSGTC